MIFALFTGSVSLLCWKQHSQWAPYNGLWGHTIWGRPCNHFSRVFFSPLGWCNDVLRQFFQMVPCKCCCLKNLWMTWCLQRFFQVKVIFKVAKVLSPALLIRRFWGYIVLTCFARISHGKDLLELGKLSFNEQFSVLQVPGRFSEDSMACSILGGETQMPVKSVRCLESHPKKNG